MDVFLIEQWSFCFHPLEIHLVSKERTSPSMLTETEENATPRAPSYNLSVNVKTQVFQEKVLPFASALPSLLNWISQATSDDQNYTHFSVSMGRL